MYHVHISVNLGENWVEVNKNSLSCLRKLFVNLKLLKKKKLNNQSWWGGRQLKFESRILEFVERCCFQGKVGPTDNARFEGCKDCSRYGLKSKVMEHN